MGSSLMAPPYAERYAASRFSRLRKLLRDLEAEFAILRF